MLRSIRWAIVTGLLLFVASGCDSRSPELGDPTKVTYAEELGVDLASMTRTESGLYLQDRELGTGAEALRGTIVRVHYTGWLPDGEQFDSSVPRGTPFRFMLGTGRVIQGWEQGILGMKVGGKRLLVIPSELGYGATGSGGAIPPYSVLVFEVELLAVE